MTSLPWYLCHRSLLPMVPMTYPCVLDVTSLPWYHCHRSLVAGCPVRLARGTGRGWWSGTLHLLSLGSVRDTELGWDMVEKPLFHVLSENEKI